MKNLILQTERYFQPLVEKGSTEHAVDIAFQESNPYFDDSDDGQGSSCLVLLKNNGILELHDNNHKLHWQVHLNSVVEEKDQDGSCKDENGWFSVQILTRQRLACCLNRSTGAIVTVSFVSDPFVELVGEFENGILAAEWSPDCEILALVVKQEEEEEQQTHHMLITMTNQFEVLSEIVLDSYSMSNDDSSSCLMSLSWRPDGKSLAVLSSSRMSEGIPSAAMETTQHQKQPLPSLLLRIYDPTDLLSTPPALGRTEDGSGKLLQNFGGPAMAWAGLSCSLLLATVQNVGSKTKICLVESNGLAHGGFTLRDKKCIVHQMAWSPVATTGIGGASTILAIHLSTISQDGENERSTSEEKVQLWYRSNYHWYLKQEFRYDPSTPISSLLWSTVEDEHLTVMMRDGSRHEYRLRWQECIADASQESTAFVVDGADLLLTPLAKTLVPPPMAAATLSLSAPIRHIAMMPPPPRSMRSINDGATGIALVHLSNDSLVIVGRPKSANNPSPASAVVAHYCPPEVLGEIGSDMLRKVLTADDSAFDSLPPCYSFHNLLAISILESLDATGTVISIDAIAVEITGTPVENIVRLALEFSTNTDKPPAAAIRCTNRIPVVDGRVLTLSHWIDDLKSFTPSPSQLFRDRRALVQLQDGQLFEFLCEGEARTERIEKSNMEALLEPCPWIIGIRRKFQEADDEHRVIGMSWRRRLYCGEVLLADSISSFDVSDRYLCYATAAASHCQLKFIATSQLWALDPLMGASEENAAVVSAEYEPRNVERGCRIVTVLHNKPVTVLQLPRGNLEGVYPRALVLPHVLDQLVHGNYKTALEMMRLQKVDLNLLVDWDPNKFMNKGAKDLLAQVSNVDHLNQFISSLRNENVTQMIHVLPMWLLEDVGLSSVSTERFDFSTKVNQVCQALRSHMVDEAKVGDALLLPVLSTYAREEPPQLQAALSLIKSKAFAQEESLMIRTRKKKLPLFSDLAQTSIQYLAFLATYEMLFDTALGMYDLDLARAVARNSQMDPKQYLPLLQKFRELPHFYSRYEIDIRLKRFPEALRNLARSSSDGEDAGEGMCVENTFRDSLALIKKQKLHQLGLELFPQRQQKREILIDLSEQLLLSGEDDHALTVLLTVPEPSPRDLILKAARSCHDWRTLFSYLVPAENDPENGTLSFVNQARDIAEGMAAKAATANQSLRREILSDAARIMLDYGDDPVEAVDFLLQAELWSEGFRVAILRGTPALAKKCTDAAVGWAQTAIDDLSERVSSFESAMCRYVEVLGIRKEAYLKGEDIPPSVNAQGDESGSLFSASSQVSHFTAASRATASSTGSSASLSTVISVASENSSFSLSGADHVNRHKSKYNLIGQKMGKQKKKKGKGRTKVIPGSERELEGLVDTLESSCLDSTTSQSFAECIIFLSRTGNASFAANMYEIYQKSVNRIGGYQEDRLRNEPKVKYKMREINGRENFEHPLERKVQALRCEELPVFVHRLFQILPTGEYSR